MAKVNITTLTKDTKYYHISYTALGCFELMPKRYMDIGKDLKYTNMKRCNVSTDVHNVIHAIIDLKEVDLEVLRGNKHMRYYVYECTVSRGGRVVVNEDVIPHVYDAARTGETWVLEPIMLRPCGYVDVELGFDKRVIETVYHYGVDEDVEVGFTSSNYNEDSMDVYECKVLHKYKGGGNTGVGTRKPSFNREKDIRAVYIAMVPPFDISTVSTVSGDTLLSTGDNMTTGYMGGYHYFKVMDEYAYSNYAPYDAVVWRGANTRNVAMLKGDVLTLSFVELISDNDFEFEVFDGALKKVRILEDAVYTVGKVIHSKYDPKRMKDLDGFLQVKKKRP